MFLIFYKDLTKYICHYKILQHANDTVVYCANNEVSSVENSLDDELKRISTFCYNNELILNLKKSKTELMLCEISRKLTKWRDLQLLYRDKIIMNNYRYKYLENIVDPSLNMTDDFDIKWKKVSFRIKIVSKMEHFLSFTAAVRIYNMMIVPLLTYSSTLHLKLSSCQISRLSNIEKCAKHNIRQNYRPKPIENSLKKQACLLVKMCLTNIVVRILKAILI